MSAAALNLAQLQAVHYLGGPCLVLAGAGSGKTRVITHKIVRLIEEGTPAANVAAITFTNKAAAEMRTRLAQLAGRAARGTLVCTFHALGVRMLREDGQAIGLKPHFSILDSGDVASILKDCAGGTADLATARKWQWCISGWKNAGLDSRAALAQAQDEDERSSAVIMQRYEERLLAYQSVDFDDLIGLSMRLLAQHAEVREKWQQRLAHVLIDEYQDTNATQYELLKLLVGEKARFTAVGDDDQSIYGWRGATLENLKKLPEDFPALKVIKLEQNYRSTSAILRAANHVIAANPKLFAKTLFSELGEGEAVRVRACDSEEHEADSACVRIQHLLASSNPPAQLKDFAILYRANHQAKPFEKALRKAGIAYRVSGGTSFFERAEIRDLCAWFRLWSNEDDDPAFVRAITSPKRGIGHTTLGKLGEFATRQNNSLFGALFSPTLAVALPKKALDGLHEFGRAINDLAWRAGQTLGMEEARGFLLEWLQDIGYESWLHESEDKESVAARRWGHVLEFCDWMAQRAGGQAEDATGVQTQAKTLLDVARNMALLSTLQEREKNQNVVTLSTLHAAKGLEWAHVTLAGVCEGLLPFEPGGAQEEEAGGPQQEAQREQEERRLMYVGITRARRTLTVSWSRKRKKGRNTASAQPSRFIAEMRLESSAPGSAKERALEKIRQLRAEFAREAEAGQASQAPTRMPG